MIQVRVTNRERGKVRPAARDILGPFPQRTFFLSAIQQIHSRSTFQETFLYFIHNLQLLVSPCMEVLL